MTVARDSELTKLAYELGLNYRFPLKSDIAPEVLNKLTELTWALQVHYMYPLKSRYSRYYS